MIMESHGVPGRIHVSEAFRDLAAGAFTFEDRGTTAIKSIGEARTFFLIGEKAAAAGPSARAPERSGAGVAVEAADAGYG